MERRRSCHIIPHDIFSPACAPYSAGLFTFVPVRQRALRRAAGHPVDPPIAFMLLRKTRRPHSSPAPVRDAALRVTRLWAALLALPGFMPLAAHAQLTGAAAQPAPVGAASAASGLRLAPQLEEHPALPGQSPATFVLGDHAAGTADQDIAIQGNGEVRRPQTVIKGERLLYNQDTDQADAYGNVHLINNGNSFVGPEAHLKVEANEGYMLSPTYHFNLSGGTGKAERINVLDNERSVVEHGTYTACQCANPAWYIKATQFDIDNGNDTGVAHNGVLFFQHVPLFASPYLSFPLTNARRSGVLPPTFGYSSTTGFDTTLPYYFNIAPNRDLTLSPRILTHRGFQGAATYRYLSPTYSGTWTGEYLPHDLQTHTNRYAVYIQHNQNFGDGFGGYINYNRVSDDQYMQDLSSGNSLLVGTQVIFQQEAGLTYNKGPWSVLGRVQHWQTLQGSLPPYEREPQLNVKYQKYDVGGFDFGAEADLTRFKITEANMIQGQRAVLNPYISYPIITPGYFIVPKVQYHLASYDLNSIEGSGAPAGQPKTLTESIPTFSFDTGLIFDRSVHLFGKDYIQTLEPRLFYVYTPYRNQNFAPLFDTAEADFGLAEIFTTNTFVGNDRVADANKLTAALTTRFLDPSTGDERARFVIAEQYYFRDQQTTLLPNQPVAQADHSDLILGASFKLGAEFASQTALQYNSQNNQLVRSNVGFAWSPADRKVVNVAYRYTRANTTLENEPINQILLSAQWPITHRLYSVGRVNFDMDGHRLVDGLLGFQYDADCWAFGIGIQRYANGLTASQTATTGTRVLAQLQLKGLSKIDNGLVQAFAAGVRGYMPLPPPAPPQSRFSDYQ